MSRLLLAVAVAVAVAVPACTPPRRPTVPWTRVNTDEVHPVYLYPEHISAYAPGDPGGYVVHPLTGATPEARAALVAALAPADPDDIVGDGVVVRLDAAAYAEVDARDDVGVIEVLQPAQRRGVLWDHDAAVAEVRIDLFVGVDDAEVDAVARWLEQRGGVVVWRGPAALRARVPQDAILDVARLGPVRWVE